MLFIDIIPSMSKQSEHKILAENRKAFHDYEILEKYSAGIVLTGTEIKSIRKGSVNLKDGFARIEDGEIWLYNVHISPYENGNRYNHEPLRTRKLLLTKQELKKLIGKIKESGLAIVPLNIHLQNGFAKVEIALAKGKTLHDKRDSISKKDAKREIEKATKYNTR